MEDDSGQRAALKLYQRAPLGKTVNLKHITDELTNLTLLNSTTASDHVPQVLAHNLVLQHILLTPVGERLTEQHVDRNLIVGLVAAVKALHAYCIHRDLRAANILVVPGVPRSVKIIDWNLGLPVRDLARAHKPEGALCVQGFDVLSARLKNAPHVYSHRDDLQSLVRAMYLLLNHVAPFDEVCLSRMLYLLGTIIISLQTLISSRRQNPRQLGCGLHSGSDVCDSALLLLDPRRAFGIGGWWLRSALVLASTTGCVRRCFWLFDMSLWMVYMF
eukprot:m.128250 g.128250  ORF g.128250 m.128250 type:complete len:274 (+) comp9410_c0_seq3:855-1676(+)